MRIIRLNQPLGVIPALLLPALTPVVAGGAAAGGWLAKLLELFKNFKGAGGGQSHTQACPEDAMTCPDGTTLTRTGPDCTFPPCPVVEEPFYQKPEFLIGAGALLLVIVLMKK